MTVCVAPVTPSLTWRVQPGSSGAQGEWYVGVVSCEWGRTSRGRVRDPLPASTREVYSISLFCRVTS